MAGQNRELGQALGRIEGEIKGITKSLDEHRGEVRENFSRVHERISSNRASIDALRLEHETAKAVTRFRRRLLALALGIPGIGGAMAWLAAHLFGKGG